MTFVGHPTAGAALFMAGGTRVRMSLKRNQKLRGVRFGWCRDGCKQPSRALTNDIRLTGREARSVKHGGLNLLVKKDEANHITLHEALPAEQSTMSEEKIARQKESVE
jgi:hypothetical protein